MPAKQLRHLSRRPEAETGSGEKNASNLLAICLLVICLLVICLLAIMLYFFPCPCLTLVPCQVPYTDCKNVPQQQCQQVPEQQCQQEPYTASQQVRLCHHFRQLNFPGQVCEDVHRKIPQRISRSVPKKTCNNGGSGPAPERQTSSGGGGYRFVFFYHFGCLCQLGTARSGSTSNELVFTGALGGSNSNLGGSNSNVKSAPQTRAGSDAINFG